ncbi:MAG: hypothetical protein PHX76_02690 [Patescibacteria group bacterium]|jgi:hypothetical protein|nr:hypothetical protein [Patescibacteria group bacterium]
MKGKYATILYLFFVLILLAGLALLFLRQPFIDYWREVEGVENVEVIIRKSPTQNDLINTDILHGTEISSLSEQVTTFSFDDICGDQVKMIGPCSEGNSNPFLIKQ